MIIINRALFLVSCVLLFECKRFTALFVIVDNSKKNEKLSVGDHRYDTFFTLFQLLLRKGSSFMESKTIPW
jgi:hypothetical protein